MDNYSWRPMNRSAIPVLAVLLAATAFSTPLAKKSPPWISIEAPVNPYDRTTRGAVLLVHAKFVEGESELADVTGSAEGLVNGARQTVPLRFETTGQQNVYALRRQWPIAGAWLTRINLRATTAIVTFDATGNVASVRVPTQLASGTQLPRAVS